MINSLSKCDGGPNEPLEGQERRFISSNFVLRVTPIKRCTYKVVLK